MACKLAVLERNGGLSRAVLGERYRHDTGIVWIWLRNAFGPNVPSERNLEGWVPPDDTAPITAKAVWPTLEAPISHVAAQDDSHQSLPRVRVVARPPMPEPGREKFECLCRRQRHRHFNTYGSDGIGHSACSQFRNGLAFDLRTRHRQPNRTQRSRSTEGSGLMQRVAAIGIQLVWLPSSYCTGLPVDRACPGLAAFDPELIVRLQ